MTDRRDDIARGSDDELVRAALLALMDDVSAQPLPEPALVRARAEGRDLGDDAPVVDLAQRRRRSFTLMAAVAAAALVAAGAAILTQGRVTTPPAASTSTTDSAGAPALQMLDSAEWSAAVGLPVAGTEGADEPVGQCFRRPQGGTWEQRVSTLGDGRVVASQWIGTASTSGGAAPTGAIDDAIGRCEQSHTISQRVTEDLPGNARFRSWHARRDDGSTVWWVEATRGASTSYLTVPELDGMTYTTEEMRQVAEAALGDLDITATDPT